MTTTADDARYRALLAAARRAELALPDELGGGDEKSAEATRRAAEFLRTLFSDTPGMLELRVLPSGRQTFAPLLALPQLLAFIEAHCETENIYVGVATRRDGTSGKLENCQALGAVFSDIDFKTTPEPEARAKLHAFPLPVSMVVQSGHGLHAYWFLRESFVLPGDEPRARALLQRLALHLGGDQSAAECARVLRVPGTWNRKPGLPPVRVELESCEPSQRYNLSELEEWLPPARARSSTNGPFHAPPDPIRPGERRLYLFRLARSLKAKGLAEEAVLAAARVENRVRCQPPVSHEEVVRQVRSAFAQADRPGYEPRSGDDENGSRRTGWDAAKPAPAFLNESEAVVDALEPHQLVRGSVTEWFSPRGLGKTMIAHALAVKLAGSGHRILLLDRDNSRREVKRRLRGWGAAETVGLKVMTRDEVPPLTDRPAWAGFPFREYDVVIIDSIDASTEGVGEQDSAKPGRAIASVLDVARRVDGPAILLLGNVIKSGAYGRGSGVVEDRADIVYEVRDATELRPSGTKPWWQELPAAGREAWGERAARRKHRDTYRLAFVPTKYRIGEEPDPFVLEVDLRAVPWTYRDVTADLEAAGHAARAAADAERAETREAAEAALLGELTRRKTSGLSDLGKTAAETLLHEHGLARRQARELLREGGTARDRAARRWRLVPDEADQRKINVQLPEDKASATSHDHESSRSERARNQASCGGCGSRRSWPKSVGVCVCGRLGDPPVSKSNG